MMNTLKVDFLRGWERVKDQEAIRLYQNARGFADSAWYKKWVGPFMLSESTKFVPALAKARMSPDAVVYDPKGYIIVPHSILQ